MNSHSVKDSTARHLLTALIYTALSVVVFGFIYPFAMTGIALVLFPHQANGSMIYVSGKPAASSIVGQLWTKPLYFHGRPSAAGNVYDPTTTGATNLAPTSKKLIDSTRDAITALRKENPNASGAIPMDLVTSSGSGIDPDISLEAAYYQAPRIAKARGMTLAAVNALIAAHLAPRTIGFLGEPRVNVLDLNLALDAAKH